MLGLEMANKLVLVSIARTRLHFHKEFLYWLGMGKGMGMENCDVSKIISSNS